MAAELEQFYTKKEVARDLFERLKQLEFFGDVEQIVEPSAGAGAFSSLDPSIIAFDAAPGAPSIIECDFLSGDVGRFIDPSKRTLLLGNPPFKLALEFMERARFAEWIAFILPASFRKQSKQRSVPRDLHLIHSHEELPWDSFELPSGEGFELNTVFQVWERRDRPRPRPRREQPPGFEFCRRTDLHDAAIVRIGSRAGTLVTGSTGDLNVNTHYFIKITDERSLDWLSHLGSLPSSQWVAGPRSISKAEIIDECLDRSKDADGKGCGAHRQQRAPHCRESTSSHLLLGVDEHLFEL